ncbi:MAG: hypothetical protein CMJ34_05805 [Phycisphaerae bacterium]|nr:hypothetical protein [Phycisphaerae bacterium]
MRWMRNPGLLPALVAGWIALALLTPEASGDVGESLARARTFLDGLPPGQREIASVGISAPDRARWSYLPGARPGLRIADLDADGRRRLDEFLTTALGTEGMARANRIRLTEPVEERGGQVLIGPDEFRIRFFGLAEDGPPPAWSWRFEGHHLSLHQTIVGDEVVSATPIFLGSVVRNDGGGEPLGREDARAEEILRSLSEEDRVKAMDPRRMPGDLRTAMLPEDRWSFEGGVPLVKSGEDGRRLADAIVKDLLTMHSAQAAEPLREAWAGTPSSDITFAWCGSRDRSLPHQWRLVSPMIIVEFSHSGGDVEHGHLVLRTRSGEFPNRAVQAWRDVPTDP